MATAPKAPLGPPLGLSFQSSIRAVTPTWRETRAADYWRTAERTIGLG
jgi:hypothetical protein